MSESPHPCCVPSKKRLSHLQRTQSIAAARQRNSTGSTDGMLKLDGGRFLMGTDSPEQFPADGEGPVREVTVDGFWMDERPVSNEQFREFVNATGYTTESQRFGWSFVFHSHVLRELVDDRAAGITWWCKVNAADWAHPEGPDTSIDARLAYPVVHISWNDAAAYASWAGKRRRNSSIAPPTG